MIADVESVFGVDTSNRKNICTCHSDMTFSVRYPEKNPVGAADDIARHLAYVGAFDGIR